jgi:hypothetical protein
VLNRSKCVSVCKHRFQWPKALIQPGNLTTALYSLSIWFGIIFRARLLVKSCYNQLEMKILGIETSCDETAVAVVEDGKKILSNIVSTSLPLHTKTGGIIPEIAAREQTKAIIPSLQAALEQARTKIEQVDAVAVTYGPGLIGSLLVGG